MNQKNNFTLKGYLKNSKFELLFFALLGLIVLVWFGGNFILFTGDFVLTMDGVGFFKNLLFAWNYTSSLGIYSPRDIAFLPYALFVAMFQFLGLSFVSIEKILYYVWFVAAAISMHFLTSVIKLDRIGKFFASIFYVVNPIAILIVWSPTGGFIAPFYVFTPLILGLFIYGLSKNQGSGYLFGFSIVWTLLLSSTYSNVVYAILHWSLLAAYMVFWIIKNRNPQKTSDGLKYAFKLFLIWSLINFFWIFPALMSIKQEIARVQQFTLSDSIDSIKFNSLKLIGSFRLLGYQGMLDSYKGERFLPWALSYVTDPFVLISFLIPILIFGSLLISKNDHTIFFAILSIGLIFLVGTFWIPFGDLPIKLAQMSEIIAVVFRNPLTRFGFLLPLPFSILLGLGSDGLYSIVKQMNRNTNLAILILITIIVLLFGIFAYPIWTGAFIYQGEGILPSWRVQIPTYYDDAAKWLAPQSEGFRIFQLPQSKRYQASYKWEYGFVGADFTDQLLKKSTIVNTANAEGAIIVSEKIEQNKDISKIGKYLGLLNVKYLLIHNDVNWDYLNGHGWWWNIDKSKLESFVNKQNGFNTSTVFKQLIFYENTYFIPRIYTTSKVTMIPVDGFIDLLERDNFSPEDILTIENEQYNSTPPGYFDFNQISELPVNDFSFESGTWRNVSDCCNAMPENSSVSASLSPDSSESNYSLNLTSGNHCACISQILRLNNTPNSIHKLSFDYKNVNGNPPEYALFSKKDGKTLLAIKLDSSKNWSKYTNYFVLTPNREENESQLELYFYSNQISAGKIVPLEIHLYSYPTGVGLDSDEPTVNFYDNISLKKLGENISENLLIDPSFESGTWHNVSDCCNDYSGIANITATLSSDSVDRKTSLNLTSKAHCACVGQNLMVENNVCYEFSLNYKHLSGKPPTFGVWSASDDKTIAEELPYQQTEWNEYKTEFCIGINGTRTTNLFDNVHLEQISLSDIEAYKPQIRFQQISPVRYDVKTINATQPFYLILSEAYSPGWKAYISNSTKPECEMNKVYTSLNITECVSKQNFDLSEIEYLSKDYLNEESHFIANTYANSWYVNKTGNYTITLFFLPQTYTYIGIIISGTFILVFMGYLIAKRRLTKR